MSPFNRIGNMERDVLILTQKQLRTIQVIENYSNKVITRKKAAAMLNRSERQITRMKKGYIEQGAEFVYNKNTGRVPAHAIAKEKKEEILRIKSLPEFEEVNFLHFQEILESDYGIKIPYTSLRSILKNAGIESPKSKKVRKTPKKRRERKAHSGELAQIDATPYEWFNTPVKYAMHGAIDDATGKLLGAYITQNECLFGYFEMMRRCIKKFGVPQSLYSDKHTIFRSPKAGKLTVEEEINGKTVSLTQFGRAMYELGVDIIYANTPEAKGRVERMWQTLQSRLPVEFAKRKITTVSEANKFLEEYVDIFNAKFSVEAADEPIFVSTPDDDRLDSILCIKQERKTDKTGIFSFKNKKFQIMKDNKPYSIAKKDITVLVGPRIGLKAVYNDVSFDVKEYIPPCKVDAPKKPEKKTKENYKANVDPHLKHGSDKWKSIWWYESYEETLAFLYELFFKKQQSSS